MSPERRVSRHYRYIYIMQNTMMEGGAKEILGGGDKKGKRKKGEKYIKNGERP